MSRVYTSWIIRYDDKKGMNGKLLGLVTFTDGKSLKVWDAELHERCKALARVKAVDVRYQIRHSVKWGDALELIESTKTDAELYDMAREQDEARGRVKANSYLGQRIAKGNQAQPVDAPTSPAEISQANTLVPADHESLMRRVG